MNDDDAIGLETLARDFQAWLDAEAGALAPFKQDPPDFEAKLEALRGLQRRLFDAGWARHGWPERFGGLGGSVLHRAVLVDLLESNGFPPRHVFEHLDILPPALIRFAQPERVEALLPATLRGDLLWCQGFSEPTAGSDLAALRTRAKPADGGYRLDGHKIWTSWAKWATHCLLLARTGAADSRHRGLTAFVVETDAPGLSIGPIRQSNGTDELAELFLDEVFVPQDARVGEEGEGWAVAMHILAGERGSYTWLRQCELLPQLEAIAREANASDHAERIGGSLLRLVALRCRARDVVEILARGEEPGPESSVSKVLCIDAEQDFYDVAREVQGAALDLGTGEEAAFWQEQYLRSRAASVYGGARQIQLNVIGKRMTSGRARGDAATSERDVLRANMVEAIGKSADGREALDGLGWWEAGSAPSDPFQEVAFSAWFEAEGETNVVSPALAGVRGREVARVLGAEPAEVAWGVQRDRDGAWLAVGLDDSSRWIAYADGASRVFAQPLGEGGPDASHALDAAFVSRCTSAQGEAREVGVDADAHRRAGELAQVAAACEIVGASRVLLAKAVEHVNAREQFGQPIAKFQAVQHLSSESQVDLSALDSVCRAALEEWRAGDARDIARIVKALAGRSGRAIAQRALQCFGAIGFTAEHPHHLHSRRIHILDACFGDAPTLTRALGRELVATGRAPRGVQAWRPCA